MADHVYKPTEVPKGQRWQYFLDYYKIPVIATVILIIAVISILKSTVFAPKTDVPLLFATEQFIDYEVCQEMQPDFEAMELDFDENGQVLVSFDCIHLDPNSQAQDPEYFNAQQMKLIAVLSSATSALQIVDESLYAYFESEELIGTYKELPDAHGHAPEEPVKIPLEELTPFKNYTDRLPSGLYMTVRPKDAMQLGDSKKKFENYMHQLEALEVMMQQ